LKTPVPTTGHVQILAHHWRPRFVANGIDVNDFDETVAQTADWKDWGPRWKERGQVHEALGREAERLGRHLSAARAYQRAAWSFHLGKFVWFEDPALHAELRDRSAAIYQKAMPQLDPPAERIEFPFEDGMIPAILRRPGGLSRPPLALLLPGLDSSKEELFTMEEEFLGRGMATLALDGPGQSESSVRFPIRPEWETVITPLLDYLDKRDPGIDLTRVGTAGISLGGIYAARAAAHDKRIKAVVELAGPYDFGDCWDGLNPLTRGAFRQYSRSADEERAKARAHELSLEGIVDQVAQPLLVVHGGRDGIIPPAQAERIARAAPRATLALFPEGNHVCNNIPYKYRPLMADWLREKVRG